MFAQGHKTYKWICCADKLNVLSSSRLILRKNDDDLSKCYLWRNDAVHRVKECTSPDVKSSVIRKQQHPHLSLHHRRTGTQSYMRNDYLHVHFFPVIPKKNSTMYGSFCAAEESDWIWVDRQHHSLVWFRDKNYLVWVHTTSAAFSLVFVPLVQELWNVRGRGTTHPSIPTSSKHRLRHAWLPPLLH